MGAQANAVADRLVENLILSRSKHNASPSYDVTEPIEVRSQDIAELKTTKAWSKLPERGSFRLLRLDAAAERNAPLRGVLLLCHLDQPPAYEAISYNWGDKSHAGMLQLTGGEDLALTANLEAGLRNFRLKDRPRLLLWVDALCIDQSSLEEKSQQVAIMAEIFKLATNVLCWLGTSVDTSCKLLTYLDQLASSTRELGLNISESVLVNPLRIEPLRTTRQGAVDILVECAASRFTDLYRRAYFSRLW
jgi:hypothetical protein